MIKHKERQNEESSESVSATKELVLHNDDFNTFDFVINSLVEVCKHELEQAEQCAMIVHFKGKCTVKAGTFDEIGPMHFELTNRNLTTTIE